jgi:hypothetical protein
MKLIPQGSTQIVVTPAPPGAPQTVQITGNPGAIYRALQNQREVLGDQLRDLQNQRNDIVRELSSADTPSALKPGLEKRLAAVDGRIASLDQQIAQSDQAVAQAAGVPNATAQPPRPQRQTPDPDMVAGLSFVVVLVFAIPISIAYARRIWRKSARTEVTLPPQMVERMESLEQGMEAIALEVERIGEGQRFLTQALQERVEIRALGGAEPVGARKLERGER